MFGHRMEKKMEFTVRGFELLRMGNEAATERHIAIYDHIRNFEFTC